ncbi:MAG: HEAT repeat domain-containing protein, partial [Myxococcota bacterium]|nr:HEAT repeat domain-containing protein [Myxococcota bacterium]
MISLVLLLWTGCDIPPRYVSQSDVGDAFIQERYKTVCKGLEMSEDETRKYAAEKLASLKQPLARDCICENIETPEGSWDPAIAKGLVSTRFPEVVECFTRLVERPDLPDRLEAVVVLKGINTSNARDTLAKVVRGEGDDEVRAKAMEGISGNSQYQELFLELLASPTETPAVRAAAAKAMAGLKAKLVASTLTRAATEDAEPEVRGAALGALRSAGAKGVDELICKSMMEDESPLVRRKAVLAFKGTKRSGPVACLRDRALTLEEDAGVRDALLTVLKSSPSDDAAKILCDAIPF